MANRITYATIVAAKSGDGEAMDKILRHYKPYIVAHSMRVLYDEYGNQYEVLDQRLKERIERKLLCKIVCEFDPSQPPEGETVEK